jgi:hypothetical protein
MVMSVPERLRDLNHPRYLCSRSLHHSVVSCDVDDALHQRFLVGDVVDPRLRQSYSSSPEAYWQRGQQRPRLPRSEPL